MKPVLIVSNDHQSRPLKDCGGLVEKPSWGMEKMTMAANKEGGGDSSWLKWFMVIAGTLCAGVVLAMGSWLFNSVSNATTSTATTAVAMTNVEKSLSAIQASQEKTLGLLNGVATKRELGEMRGDLQAQIDELKDKLAIVERELALINDREKRK